MRSRIVRVAVAATTVAVLLLGVPLAFAISTLLTSGERNELERQALRASVAVSPDYTSGDQVELDAPVPGVDVGVYDLQGRLVTGHGPTRLEESAASSVSGRVYVGETDALLVVAVPVASGETVIAVARASSSRSALHTRILWWWLGIAALASVSALAAGLLAWWQGTRLARPLSELSQSAARLGEGDFSVRSAASGVPEIDHVSGALNRTAERLASLVERERSFAARASHQLRTPLTRLQLELERAGSLPAESARASMPATLATLQGLADHLSETVDDVLSAARETEPRPELELSGLLEQAQAQWHGAFADRGRPLRLRIEQPPVAAASKPAVRQIVQVLLDNALRHGSGEVTIRARDAHGATAIDVSDAGIGPAILLTGNGHGLGLPMALALANAERGRLVVDRSPEGTRFTLLLPHA